jgi:hypothetical protein
MFDAAKKYFCAVTFPKSIVRSNTAFSAVQTALAEKIFGASIPEATDNRKARKECSMQKCRPPGGGSFH